MRGNSTDWVFISNPDMRSQCDYHWPLLRIGDWVQSLPRRRCTRDGKFFKDDEYRCGYHTPGVGSYRGRKVPKDYEDY